MCVCFVLFTGHVTSVALPRFVGRQPLQRWRAANAYLPAVSHVRAVHAQCVHPSSCLLRTSCRLPRALPSCWEGTRQVRKQPITSKLTFVLMVMYWLLFLLFAAEKGHSTRATATSAICKWWRAPFAFTRTPVASCTSHRHFLNPPFLTHSHPLVHLLSWRQQSGVLISMYWESIGDESLAMEGLTKVGTQLVRSYQQQQQYCHTSKSQYVNNVLSQDHTRFDRRLHLKLEVASRRIVSHRVSTHRIVSRPGVQQANQTRS